MTICRVIVKSAECSLARKKKNHGSKFFSKAQNWLIRGTIQLGELYTNLLFPWKSQFQAVLREAGDTELLCSPKPGCTKSCGHRNGAQSFLLFSPTCLLASPLAKVAGRNHLSRSRWVRKSCISQTGLGWNPYSTIN